MTERTREILAAIFATVIGTLLAVNMIRGFLYGAWNW